MKKFLLPLVVVFSLAIPAVAQAHYATLAVACGEATITWSEFTAGGTSPGNDNNGGLNTPTYTLIFQPASGGSPVTYSGGVSFGLATYTLPIAIVPVNGTFTYANSTWTSAQTTDKVHGHSTAYDIPVTGCTTTTTTTTTSSTSTTPSTSTTTSTTTTSTTPSTTTTSTTPSTTTTTTATPAVSTTSTTTTSTGSGGVKGVTIPIACTVVKVTLSKTKVTTNKQFTAVVRGSGIKSVVFYIDGRAVKTLTKANSGSTGFAYTIPVSKGRYGTHLLTTKTTTKCGSPQDGKLSYSRVVPARAVVPKFTG